MLPKSLRQKKIALTCLGLLFTGIFLSPGRPVSTDIESRLLVTRALWQQGTPVVDEPFAGAVRVDGGWTHYYGMGQSLLLVPFDMAGVALTRILGLDGKNAAHGERLFVYLLFLPLIGVLWWLFSLRLMERLGFPFSSAYPGSLIFFLGTISYVYAFQSSQEEALVGLCLIAALCSLLDWEQDKRPTSLIAAGFLAGWATLVRLNFLTSLAPLGAIVLREFRRPNGSRNLGLGFVGFLVPLSFHFGLAYLRFGSPLATGYDLAAEQNVGGVRWILPQWQMFLALLAGPGKGLLFLSPILLFAAWGWRQWKNKDPYLCWGVTLSCIASLLVSSAIYNNPDGSEAWGTRYQVHLVPLLGIPVWLAWGQWSATTKRLAKGALALGMILNLSAAVYPWSLEYEQFQGDTLHRMGMISSPTHGQAVQRLKNIVRGHSPSTLFAPNVWSVTYSRKMGSWAPGLVGVLFLLFGIVCLRKAAHLSESLPDPIPRKKAA